MITDSDTHYLRPDACDYLGPELGWGGNALRLLDGGGAQQVGRPAAD